MNILFYFFCNSATGYGHYYRSMALAQYAHSRGHKITIACDKLVRGYNYQKVHQSNPSEFQRVVSQCNPDWIVADLHDGVPPYVFQSGKRICLIDGIAQPDSPMADLVISQGYEGSQYCAPLYVILRPELWERHNRYNPGENWFVFGGGADVMGLITKFQKAKPDQPAFLVKTDFIEPLDEPNSNQWITSAKDEAIFGIMSQSRQAVVAMGMTVWETVAMGIPTYVFSRSKRHLASATAMAQRGLVKAYPEVGLPGIDEFVDFVDSSFIMMREQAPDGDGVKRVLTLMEDK